MKKRHLLFFFAAFPLLLAAQNCPCSEQFDWLREKLARNYSGYRDKVTPQTQAALDRHTGVYRPQIAAATSDTACLRLLTDWARWFRDGHVQLYAKAAASDDPIAIRARFAAWETIPVSEAEVRTYLDQPGRDPVEGIYQNAQGNYRVALLQKTAPGRDFAALVLKADSVWWMPGQVKFDLKQTAAGRYTARYYMRDHSERNPSAKLERNALDFGDLGAWYRLYPGDGAAAAPPKAQLFTLNRLDDSTLVLRLPTMSENYRLELDSLVKANSALLERTPYLIIDCRGNGGGSDITFYPLVPYVFSGKVKGFRGQIYATHDNAQKYELMRTNKNFPKKYRRGAARIARRMHRNLGEFIGKCGEWTFSVKTVKSNPQKVAILTDGDCASSCEQFVFFARQSKRVTLIGQNTAGIADYGNLHNLDFPCRTFGLAYPTSRSCAVDAGQGIDGTGLPPALRIDDKDADWVKVARAYLAGKK